jgi:hypothetical protein
MSAAVTSPSPCLSITSVRGVASSMRMQQRLDVQDDVGDVLDHTRDGGELVERTLDPDRRDR